MSCFFLCFLSFLLLFREVARNRVRKDGSPDKGGKVATEVFLGIMIQTFPTSSISYCWQEQRKRCGWRWQRARRKS